MYMGCIVIACNSGGPLESIAHEKTGFLLESKPKLWADQIQQIANDEFKVSFDDWLDEGQDGYAKEAKLTVETIQKNAGKRVLDMFSEKAFGDRLVDILTKMD